MRRIRHPKRIVKVAHAVKTKEGDIPFVLSRSSGRRTLTITVDEHAQVLGHVDVGADLPIGLSGVAAITALSLIIGVQLIKRKKP